MNRDIEPGFALGANLPWLRYGGDFGASAWWPRGGVAHRRSEVDEALARLADAGLTLVRWFVLGDGRAGLRSDDRGQPIGLDRHIRGDVEAALESAQRHGIRLLLVALDFLWVRRRRMENGVQLGGRRRSILDATLRERLLDDVLAPLFACATGAPALAGWDLFNEPEWATLRFGGRRRLGALAAGPMRALLAGAVARAHDSGTVATVGLASARGLPLVAELGLDLYQVHWYDTVERRAPLATPVAAWRLDRPVLLGEFPTRNSRHSPAQIVQLAREAGYSGALGWSVHATDRASGGLPAFSAVRA